MKEPTTAWRGLGTRWHIRVEIVMEFLTLTFKSFENYQHEYLSTSRWGGTSKLHRRFPEFSELLTKWLSCIQRGQTETWHSHTAVSTHQHNAMSRTSKWREFCHKQYITISETLKLVEFNYTTVFTIRYRKDYKAYTTKRILNGRKCKMVQKSFDRNWKAFR